MTTFLLQETGSRYTVETGYGSLLDEISTVRGLAEPTPSEPADTTRQASSAGKLATVAASQPVRTVRRQTHRHIGATTASKPVSSTVGAS